MNDLQHEASELDVAFGKNPNDRVLFARRADVLDRLSITEHGVRFCYIPGGTFLMGAYDGDPDERPIHPSTVSGFWLSETTFSWGHYIELMGWDQRGFPPTADVQPFESDNLFYLAQANKIRYQYCEDKTAFARDWHSHVPQAASTSMFGAPQRSDDSAYSYWSKPMVAVAWQDAEDLCLRISTPTVLYRLPSEAEWEKAARGGLVGCRYSWGEEPPTPDRCDFNRFGEFSILPFRSHPPNGYGLYAMCGSVWEWTSDAYDALAYQGKPSSSGLSSKADESLDSVKADGQNRQRVLRGGSWTDSADAVTVSFRMSRSSESWRAGRWGKHLAPNIGFRIARIEL